jgi:hypothetical protein
MKDETGEDHDHPFEAVLRTAQAAANRGAETYQKFTCSNCRLRQGFDEANHWWTHGRCERCNTITNIYKQGCNYILVSSIHDTKPKQIIVHDSRNREDLNDA